MEELRYTLITDGSSDIVLIPILNWLLRENGVKRAIQPEWADLRRFHLPPRGKLTDKIRSGLDFYPCDLLFVHRDAEKEARLKRIGEINKAVTEVLTYDTALPYLCVVPIRMQEAWLLFDEDAIKHAAGNRSYRPSLVLPPLKQIEKIPDPKAELHQRLREASGLRGRRLRNFRTSYHAHRVAEFITDFSPLRQLSAFAALETDIRQIIQQNDWDG